MLSLFFLIAHESRQEPFITRRNIMKWEIIQKLLWDHFFFKNFMYYSFYSKVASAPLENKVEI